MRGFLSILLFFAVVGIGVGLLMLMTKVFGAVTGFADAAIIGLVPTMIGVVALAGATIVLAIDEARRDQVAMLNKIAARLGAER